ncbi:thioredoxin-like protein [Roseimicrobium gellanilyticum]|uniref:Thioredoxin-like protein n=1 Tax=Roseimicrobium gellanilyticum TaxID=748857 RepID=A0A366HNG5_9BACT|nr:thioredoxin family protein [Roseimicrobium gellanilyticum]RBP43862.1 thioredoxin-like protein [Roseimicrobium gellanilyticum]
MKSLSKFLAVATLALASFSLASDFPEGSPAFVSTLTEAKTKAKAEGKPVIAVYSAVWCPPCQAMKKKVYPSAEVKKYHDKFVWAYIDTDVKENGPDAQAAGVTGIPHIQFLDKDGKEIDKQVGGTSPDDFADKLAKVLKKAK